MSSNTSQEGLKSEIVKKEKETDSSVKKSKNDRYTIDNKFSDKVVVEKNSFACYSVLGQEDIFKVFPFLKGSINKGQCKAILASHIAYVKATGSLETKQEFKLAPPPDISDTEWLCFLGPLCPTFFRGAASIDTNEASRVFGSEPCENSKSYSKFLQTVLFKCFSDYCLKAKLKTEFPDFNLLTVAPLCLYPIVKEKDLLAVQKFLDPIPTTSVHLFACPHHFKRPAEKNKTEAYLGVIQKEEPGDLKIPPVTGFRKDTFLVPYYERVSQFHSDTIAMDQRYLNFNLRSIKIH